MAEEASESSGTTFGERRGRLKKKGDFPLRGQSACLLMHLPGRKEESSTISLCFSSMNQQDTMSFFIALRVSKEKRITNNVNSMKRH